MNPAQRDNGPDLGAAFDADRISPSLPRTLKHRHLIRHLRALQKTAPDVFSVKKAGESVEGREVMLVKMGTGPAPVLMWSQMHGNEPTATNALLDIFNFLVRQRESGFARSILEGVTLYALPMLNPDGAEYDQRRNAQGLDINRDARDLATPEGRILQAVAGRVQPAYAFNLHDQNGRRTVGDTNRLVAIALLVPPLDAAESRTPQIVDAQKIASVICGALESHIPGHISRYDAGFMPRAFGEAMQISGVRTVLVEAGGWYEDAPDFLVRMNFVALLAALEAIGTATCASADPDVYLRLPLNDKELFDLLIKDAALMNRNGEPPFRGDIGVNFSDAFFAESVANRGRITDIGDMGYFSAKRSVDAAKMLAVPGLIGLVADRDPLDMLQSEAFLPYLQNGYTTLVFSHRVSGGNSLAKRIRQLRDHRFPVNIGFVVDLEDLLQVRETEQATLLGDALEDGALAVVYSGARPDGLHPLAGRIVRWLNRRETDSAALSDAVRWPELLTDRRSDLMHQRARLLGIHERGGLRLGDFADIGLFRYESGEGRISESTPEYVFVNGYLAFSAGSGRIEQTYGTILSHS